MLKSMTGFGKAETTTGNKRITVEIRSLNSKQADISVRMPSAYRALDQNIRSLVSKGLSRGKIDLYINTEVTEGVPSATIDDKLFCAYYGQLSELCSSVGMHAGSEEMNSRLTASILRLPEVVKNRAEELSDEETEALMTAVREAVCQLDGFRAEEGGILITDIMERVGKIESMVSEIEPFEATRREAVRKRLMDGFENFGVTVDPNRMEQEMIFYIEKLDITEEKIRLANHCRYFREVVGSEAEPGRKLGFIAQEMGREINTLGSKANDSDIQRVVVRMKDELEKIKEQLLNIL